MFLEYEITFVSGKLSPEIKNAIRPMFEKAPAYPFSSPSFMTGPLNSTKDYNENLYSLKPMVLQGMLAFNLFTSSISAG